MSESILIVVVWDLEKNTLVNQFYQCGPNPKITLYDNVVRTGDHMGEVLVSLHWTLFLTLPLIIIEQMFDLRVGKCVESFKGHTTSVLSLKAGGDWRPFTFYSHAATVKYESWKSYLAWLTLGNGIHVPSITDASTNISSITTYRLLTQMARDTCLHHKVSLNEIQSTTRTD